MITEITDISLILLKNVENVNEFPVITRGLNLFSTFLRSFKLIGLINKFNIL